MSIPALRRRTAFCTELCSITREDKLQVKVTENDVGVIVGTGENAYVILDNPLLYGASDAEIRPYAEPVYNQLSSAAAYVPCAVSARGDPSLEAGDVISVGCYKYDVLIDSDDKAVLDADANQILVQHGSVYTGRITLPIFNVAFDWNGGTAAEYSSTGSESREALTATNRRELRRDAAYAELKASVDEVSSAVYDENGNSLIQQNADRINLVVNPSDDSIRAAQIILAINNDESEIKIAADKVSVTGFVTFENLTDGQTTISGSNIKTGTIQSANYSAGASGMSINLNSETIAIHITSKIFYQLNTNW